MKEYWKRLTPARKEARLEKQRAGGFGDAEKVFIGARAAKKKAYAADEQARAAEKQARAEARAAEEQARADARVTALAELTALTEETAAVLRAGGRAADLLRRHAEARATDADLEAKGDAAKVKESGTASTLEITTRKRKQKAKISCGTRPGSWSRPPVCWCSSSAVGPRC